MSRNQRRNEIRKKTTHQRENFSMQPRRRFKPIHLMTIAILLLAILTWFASFGMGLH